MLKVNTFKKIIVFLLCLTQISNISAVTLKEVYALIYQDETYVYNEDDEVNFLDNDEKDDGSEEDFSNKKEEIFTLYPVVYFNKETGIQTTEFNGERISSLFVVTLTESQARDINNILDKSLARAYNINTREELDIFVSGDIEGIGHRFITLHTNSGLSQEISLNIVAEIKSNFNSTVPEGFNRGGLTDAQINQRFDRTRHRFNISAMPGHQFPDGLRRFSFHGYQWHNQRHNQLSLTYLIDESAEGHDLFSHYIDLPPLTLEEYKNIEDFKLYLIELLTKEYDLSFGSVSFVDNNPNPSNAFIYFYGNEDGLLNVQRPTSNYDMRPLNIEYALDIAELDFGNNFIEEAGYVNYGIIAFDMSKIISSPLNDIKPFIVFTQPIILDDIKEGNFISRVSHNSNGFLITLDELEEWQELSQEEIENNLIERGNISSDVAIQQGDEIITLPESQVNLKFSKENIEDLLNAEPGVFRLEITTEDTFISPGGGTGAIEKVGTSTMPIDIRIGHGNDIHLGVNNNFTITGAHPIVLDYNFLQNLQPNNSDRLLLKNKILDFSSLYARTSNVPLLNSVQLMPEILNNSLNDLINFNMSNEELIGRQNISITVRLTPRDAVVYQRRLFIANSEKSNVDISNNKQAYMIANNFTIRIDLLEELISNGNIIDEIKLRSNLEANDVKRNMNFNNQAIIDYSELEEAIESNTPGVYNVKFSIEEGRFTDLEISIEVLVKDVNDTNFPNTGAILRANNFAINIDHLANEKFFEDEKLTKEAILKLSEAIVLSNMNLQPIEGFEIILRDSTLEVPKEVGVYEINLTIYNPDIRDVDISHTIYITLYDDNSTLNNIDEELLVGNSFIIGVEEAQYLDENLFFQKANASAYFTNTSNLLKVNVLDENLVDLDFETYEWTEGRHNVTLETETKNTQRQIVVIVSDDIDSSEDGNVNLITKSFAISEARLKELQEIEKDEELIEEVLILSQANGFSFARPNANIKEWIDEEAIDIIRNMDITQDENVRFNIMAQLEENTKEIGIAISEIEMWVVKSPGILTKAPGEEGHITGQNQQVLLANHFIIHQNNFEYDKLSNKEILKLGNVRAFEVVGPDRNIPIDTTLTSGSISKNIGVQTVTIGANSKNLEEINLRAIVRNGSRNEIVENGMYINGNDLILEESFAKVIEQDAIYEFINPIGGSFISGVIEVDMLWDFKDFNRELFKPNVVVLQVEDPITGETIETTVTITVVEDGSILVPGNFIIIPDNLEDLEGKIDMTILRDFNFY